MSIRCYLGSGGARTDAQDLARSLDNPATGDLDRTCCVAGASSSALCSLAIDDGGALGDGFCRPSVPAIELAAMLGCRRITGRARCAEECRTGSAGLAQSGAGFRRRLMYALRRLYSNVPVACALWPARRRTAAS